MDDLNQDTAVEKLSVPAIVEATSEIKSEATEANAISQFQELVAQLSTAREKLAAIHHDERCGVEEVCNNEGGIYTSEFVCYCDQDRRWKKAQQELEPLLQQTSDFAYTQGIHNQKVLEVHQQVGDLNRAYATAKTLKLVEPQLDLLQALRQFEEGAELAMQHHKHNYALSFLEQAKNFPRLLAYAQREGLHQVAIETFLKLDDVEGALRYAEDKALHRNSLSILRSRQRTAEAINYAERYGLHDQALEMLLAQGNFETWFDYGAKHNCLDLVRTRAKKVLEELLNENKENNLNWQYSEKGRNDENQASTVSASISRASEARGLCAALETHQLSRSAALYREVVGEFEKRIKAKGLIREYEEEIRSGRVSDWAWFDVADLELSLGNVARYTKVWQKTKEMWEQRSLDLKDPQQSCDEFEHKKWSDISLAQGMIEHPQYHSAHPELPKWGYSSQHLLLVAMPLAELLEAEDSTSKKKYPVVSLEEVMSVWGTAGMNTFLGLDNFAKAPWGVKDHPNCHRGSELLETLAASLKSVHTSEAFTFIVHNYPGLFQANCSEIASPLSSRVAPSEKSEAAKFNRLGSLLEYVFRETASDEEGSIRKKIALENLLYVPAINLNRENIFALSAGGTEARWKQAMSGKESYPDKIGYPHKKSLHPLDERLQAIQGIYPHFDEATQESVKQLYLEAYSSLKGIKALDRVLTLYAELRKACGKPRIFPVGHPFFLGNLPSEGGGGEEKEQPLPALLRAPLHAARVMGELFSLPGRRMEVAEAALGKPLPEFFRAVLASYDSANHYSLKTDEKEIASRLSQLCYASEEQLDKYHCAWQRTKEAHKGGDAWRFLKLQVDSTEDLLEHYDLFSKAILAKKSSLVVGGTLATHIIETPRTTGPQRGIRERMLREYDGIRYLFKELYAHSQTQQFKDDSSFRRSLIAQSVKFWRKKQERVVPTEVMETLAHFNFQKFFQDEDRRIQSYLQKQPLQKRSLERLFEDQPDLLLPRFLDIEYYDDYLRQEKFSDEFTNALNRLKNGLSTSWSFDEVRLEFNSDKLNDFFNQAGECTGNGGKYQRYGYAHMQDCHLGIIAANLYEVGKYKTTTGKGFLARGKTASGKELLYVDGVVMLQDIADFLAEPHKESHWLPMFTKAIILTAAGNNLDEILVNASHKLAQRTVWQYVKHTAELLGLQEGEEKDFTYWEGRVDDGGSPGQKISLKTGSEEGFKLSEEAARQNCHYLEKIPDDNYRGQHLLEGFWINHWDHQKAAPEERKNSSSVYACSGGILAHSDTPQINDGKGYVIGFRRRTEELAQKFNEKYGKDYGVVDMENL